MHFTRRLPIWTTLAGLTLALALAGCGDSDREGPDDGAARGSVVVRHDLAQRVPMRVEQKRFTGLDAGGHVVFGPVLRDRAAEIRLEKVPVEVAVLRIEYLDGPTVVGVHEASIQLDASQVLEISNPLITFLVAVTTLDRTFAGDGASPYQRLARAPGWPLVVREDLAPAQEGREARRTARLSVAHMSDVHLIDAESPLRNEFLRNLTGLALPTYVFQGAWRPHETLTNHVVAAMVQEFNELARGPVTGRPFDLAVTTGDTSDNRHLNDVERFLTLMDGGTLVPSSGDPDVYEGVQDDVGFDPQYWHPDPGAPDQYKDLHGFPDYPGLLEAALQPFPCPGIAVRWFTTYGNHDNLIQGNFPPKGNIPPENALEQIAGGTTKILALPLEYALMEAVVPGSGVDLFLLEFLDPLGVGIEHDWPAFIGHWTSLTTPSRQVTPDSGRHLFSPAEFVQAHLDSPAVPGPPGHGFTAASRDQDIRYYTFEPAPGLLGITLDTVNPAGEADGSLDQEQAAWLEDRLREVHSHYYDAQGNLVQTASSDSLVVLFSHHHLSTLINGLVDPDHLEPRVLSYPLEQILHRYPNVVLWLSGHSHICRIFPHPDPQGRTGGFWEVNTPSLVDYPQQGRTVELVDNGDGTLSIFAVLVDHAAPAGATVTPQVLDLAAISRELSANDPQIDNAVQLGQPEDRNVELLIQAPF